MEAPVSVVHDRHTVVWSTIDFTVFTDLVLGLPSCRDVFPVYINMGIPGTKSHNIWITHHRIVGGNSKTNLQSLHPMGGQEIGIKEPKL